jgi:FkbM family methyltransferase
MTLLDEERRRLINRLSKAARRSRRDRWLRGVTQPWQTVCVRYLRASGSSRDVQARTFFGPTMAVMLPEHVSISLWRYGFVEEEVCLFLLTLLPSGGRFVDIGAHFGFFTLLGAHLVGETGHVLAVEPMPATHAILHRNSAAYRHIETCRCAAFSEARPVIMYDYGVEFSAYNSAIGVRRGGLRSPKGGTKITVDGRRMDHLLEERGWEGVDVIKIDAESSEGHVLRGCEQTILRSRPAAIVEVGDYGIEGSWESERIVGWFEDRGYEPFEAEGTRIVRYRRRRLDDHANLLFLPHERRATNASGSGQGGGAKMRDLRRYLSDPYYWRRAVLRLSEVVTRRLHPETHLDLLVTDDIHLMAPPRHRDRPLPGEGLRLLYVAPTFDYGNPARGYSYEENHFMPALVGLGVTLIRFDSLTLLRRLGRRAASDLLVELAFRFQPDVAFFVLFRDDFEEAAVEELRRLGCVTFNWFTDDHWRFESFSSRWAPRFSWAITTDPGAVMKYRERGINHVIRSQWGVNHRLYRPLDRPRRFPVSFIGQPHGRRRGVLDALRREGITVEAWGYGWPRGKITTRQAVEVINESDVNLNLSNASMGAADQIKGRDFEVPACCALLLTGNVAGLGDYYDLGSEVLTYESDEDLAAKIRWVISHPQEAEQIRQAGYRRVLEAHTYEHRFAEIFRSAGVLR